MSGRQGQLVRMGHTWNVRGNVLSVFHLVADPRTFPHWLRVVKGVEPTGPAARPVVGESCTMWVRSLLPYGLRWEITIARIEPGRLIETDCHLTLADRFSLRGRVSFRFEQLGDRVVVTNHQELRPQRPLPRWLAPLVTWAFRLNHAWAMCRARRPLEQLATAGADTTSTSMLLEVCPA